MLLKNEGNILPLAEDADLAVIGHMAQNMRYQGAGSSHVNARKADRPLDFFPVPVMPPAAMGTATPPKHCWKRRSGRQRRRL